MLVEYPQRLGGGAAFGRYLLTQGRQRRLRVGFHQRSGAGCRLLHQRTGRLAVEAHTFGFLLHGFHKQEEIGRGTARSGDHAVDAVFVIHPTYLAN
ncbi:hypothetical protein D3C78_1277570 [compost metagenome]